VSPAAASYRASGLVLWHFCDMPGRTANVRYWGEIGLNADIGIGAAFGPISVIRRSILL
jgi:hypothetical protein